ncbi:polysaccharide pyruvyl transferase family protein [Nodosilinea sp. PGN35]|uniref:polysaccharide pyruvyl transferase family protein n=1 Tax=Nodosilinea sp. PGN35 TaxID=3020489 RepID=UPI0023B33ED1|nr:polysaccharide pyruvyl transferase family protein [Nodosilinea sp. TSF1-S3]MDF0367311.1 polysaccharide pyruvyl transferase family protein [Nodosilinea sp. TSF1-S3]
MREKNYKNHSVQILYDARTQFENLGDLVINKILLDELRLYAKLVINIQGVPTWYQEALSVLPEERVDEKNIKFRHRVLLNGLRACFAGDKNVFLVTNPGHHYGSMKAVGGQPLKLLFYLILLRLSGIKVCRFGVSIGPFTGLRVLIEKVRSKFTYFDSVRDSLSINYAKSIGLKEPLFFPDLAWLIKTDFLDNTIQEEDRDFVVFSFRDLSSSAVKPLTSQTNLFDKLDIIAEFCVEKLSKKILITYQVEHDYEFSKEIFDRYSAKYGNVSKVEFIESRLDTVSMQMIYSQSYITFSNRLHVLMFSMAHGSLPIGIVDSNKNAKIVGIFLDSGMADLLLDISSCDRAFIEEKLKKIADELCSMRGEIKKKFESNRTLGKTMMKDMFCQVK